MTKQRETAVRNAKSTLQNSPAKKSSTPPTKKKKTEALPPIHILLRVRAENGKTFTEHGRIIKEEGSAMLGKMGNPVGPDFSRDLNEQIGTGVPTFLFLTTREGWNGPYVTYRCRLKSVEATLPQSKLHLVPEYYAHEHKSIESWFNISTMDKLSMTEMNRIYVLSSGRHVMSVVKSSAAVFRVAIQK
jgi:hypothetical protein